MDSIIYCHIVLFTEACYHYVFFQTYITIRVVLLVTHVHLCVTGLPYIAIVFLSCVFLCVFFCLFFFIQFNVPFKIISLIETSQSIDGAKREYHGKPPDTPAM